MTKLCTEAFFSCFKLQSITIPPAVNEIGSHVFQNCNDLKSIINFEKLKIDKIDEESFWNCYNITSITIPASVEKIGHHAFHSCISLETLDFTKGAKLKTIGYAAFCECSKLQSFVIPSSVREINNSLFLMCTELKRVTILCDVSLIPMFTFSCCENLTTICYFGTVVPEIEEFAFENCFNLKTVYVPGAYRGNDFGGFNVVKVSDIPDICPMIEGEDFQLAEESKSNQAAMFGAIGSILAVMLIGVTIFIIKHVGYREDIIDDNLEGFDNEIQDKERIDYENPLYNPKDEKDDPFHEDFD